MTDTYCAACPRPTTTGTLCPDCTASLDNELEHLPWLLQQLGNAATRQARLGTAGGRRQTENPLPFNPLASAELTAIAAEVRLWQERAADQLGEPVRYPNPVHAARWMHEQRHRLTTWVDAGHLLDSLERIHDRVTELINRPEPRQFLGDCRVAECPGRILAHPSEHEARCDTCGTDYDAQELRAALLAGLDDQLLTAAEIARVAAYMGLSVTREQVRKRVNVLANRRRITPITLGTDDDPDGEDMAPRFRFREVRLILEADEERRMTRAG